MPPLFDTMPPSPVASVLTCMPEMKGRISRFACMYVSHQSTSRSILAKTSDQCRQSIEQIYHTVAQ